MTFLVLHGDFGLCIFNFECSEKGRKAAAKYGGG
jgi:hypothetical protein